MTASHNRNINNPKNHSHMKAFIATVFFFCLSAVLQARDMKQLFIGMPTELLPELSADNKLDCIDFLASGMKATVQNKFGENSSLLVINDKYALMKVSSAMQCEMRLLTDGSDSLICIVKTSYTPGAESTVEFYDTKWHKQPSSAYLTMPSLKDFETAAPHNTQVPKPGTVLIQARLSDSEDAITFTLDCWDSNPDLRNQLEQCLKKELPYRWQKNRFEPSSTQ